MSVDFLGYNIVDESTINLTDSIFNSLLNNGNIDYIPSKRWFACLNPHSYVLAKDDLKYSQALKKADWLVPDGIGIIVGLNILCGRIIERITGYDLFTQLHKRMNQYNNFSVFFLGSTEETLSIINNRMAKDYPNIKVSGVYSPPFKDNYSQSEIDQMISIINSVNPDILWIGMTAPKQEKWIYDHIDSLNIRLAGPIGAVFDFYAGTIKRSPPIFLHSGLEWLPRLIQQPKRLWRRTFISAPIFIADVLLAKIKKI